MSELFNQLQIELSPKLCGLIWITDEPITNRPKGFVELDYFFDGLLTTFERENANSLETTHVHDKTFFSTTSFGEDFSLAHIKKGTENFNKELASLFELLEASHRNDNRKIAILNFSSASLPKIDNAIELLK